MDDARFNAEGLVKSGDYARTMDEAVLPWLAARRTDLTVRRDGDRPLFCSRFDAESPVGTVLVLHGFTESVEKFAELIHSLVRCGYSVVAYDQRGHGRSWRDPSIADRSLTHVERFEEYVADMEAVCERVLAAMPKPWLLVAHSMGGAVAGLYMERHAGVFARAALCAPMIAPNTAGLPNALARLMCGAAHWLGQDRRRVFASKPYAGPEDFDTGCAASRERFEWYDAIKARTPDFQNNGPTYGWTREALRASRMLLAPGAAERIDASVLLFTAEDDQSVLPDAQAAFAARLRRGERRLVPGSRHEIYRSRDDVLFGWWGEILAFYRSEE